MSDGAEVTFRPPGWTITVSDEQTLLEAASDSGIGIESLCAGKGLCGTCKVKLEAGASAVSPPTAADEFILSSEELTEGYRLSCRCAIVEGASIDVSIPPSSQKTGGIILTEGRERPVDLDPAVANYPLLLDPPSLEDNVADRERVLEGIERDYDLVVDDVDVDLLREVPTRLRSGEGEDGLEVTATVYDERELIDLQAGFVDTRYGLAIDVGTTTLAVYLVDLDTGQVEGVTSALNPQTSYGGDIMTRMRYCRNNDDGRETLQTALLDGLNDAIDSIATEAAIATDDIFEAVFVGNTAMHHLCLGIDPTNVAGSPYISATHAPVAVKARTLGVDIHPRGYLYWLPVSGGWVGPDKVAVLLASGHYAEDALTVCIDIGTNGEISVGNAGGMLTTSAPAGPALEGGELTHGVRAQAGAIDHVAIDRETHEPVVETIEDRPAVGICGSGVIDALAQLFLVGLVDRRGTFTEVARGHERVRANEHDVLEYVLVWAADAAVDHDIELTQNDIRDVQMAKAAIQAGTNVLLDELAVDDIDRVVVSGAFGNYIDPDAARIVGLYPDTDPEAFTSLGNGAGVGAQLALLERGTRAEAERVVDFVEYFEIAGTDVFQDHFLQAMYLPHQVFERHPLVRETIEQYRTPIDVEQPSDGSNP